MTEEMLAAIVSRFPARLRELRERANLSQIDLSKRSGVPQTTVAAYEVGRNSPSWDRIVRLASALGVSPDAFLVEAQKNNQNPS
jgi:transcriptional regulator with XRE-family HTH domain